MLFACAILFSFCSMTYELLLGQSLSAFLGNTLLRYSATIGLYMFSLGFGAYFAGRRWEARPLAVLLSVEAVLALLGGLSVILLHLLNLVAGGAVFSFFAHAIIVLVGIFSGFELPLLMQISMQRLGTEAGRAERTVLAASYIGAFAATIVFAFWFYPRAGLVATAFAAALVNCLAALLIWFRFRQADRSLARCIFAPALLTVAFAAAWLGSETINEQLVRSYLSAASGG